MPVISNTMSIVLMPLGFTGAKPPSLTYFASLAKYVPRPHTESPRVPEAKGWKPCMGLQTTDSTASVPWNAQRVCNPGSKDMPWSSMDFLSPSQLGLALPSSCWPFSTRSIFRILVLVQRAGSKPQYIGGSLGCDLKMLATCSNSGLLGLTSKSFCASMPLWLLETQKRFSNSGLRPNHCSATRRWSVTRSRQELWRLISGPRLLRTASMSLGNVW
mmetsp:Transcript_10451/g.28357  ORF Transcript_10451/g.28357 Transcript_10451/m.28357 type:complete len:216 (+) Transcript_10451:251-898(+)